MLQLYEKVRKFIPEVEWAVYEPLVDKAIEHDTETWPNFESGYEIEKVMDAVDRSALSGKWIKI